MNMSAPLQAKGRDGVLQVIVPGRITQKSQDAQSIASQHQAVEKWLRQHYCGAMNVIRLGEQMSGWVPDRPSMVTAKELILTGSIDLVVANELREIYRNPAEHWRFVFFCVDHDVRVILLFDNIDTADGNWEMNMHVASMRTGMEVPAARMRVRRMADQSFSRGGMVSKVKYGYRKLAAHEALTGEFGPPGLRIMKLHECTPIIDEMRQRILRNQSPAAIAQWLRDESISTGPYVSGGQWTDRVVESLLRDPILSGQRSFRKFLHKHHYESGKHRRLRNDEAAEIKQWPELAHMTPQQQAEMIGALDRRAGGREFVQGRDHVRWSVPRSDSIWPGQHACCAVCGATMYRFGAFLKCKNAVSHGTHSCWNRVQVRIDSLHERVLPWVMDVLGQHPGIRDAVISAAWTEYQRVLQRRRSATNGADGQLAQWTKEAANLRKAIRFGGELESLVADLAATERKIAEARKQKEDLTISSVPGAGFFTRKNFAERIGEIFLQAAESSFKFAALLRRLIPVFQICPVQALDCGQVHARAKLTLRFDPWANESEPSIEHSAVIDAFEYPEHVKHRPSIVAAHTEDRDASLRELAVRLDVNYMTIKRSLDYDRRMRVAGLDDPYRELHEPPELASRWGKRGVKSNREM